LNPSVANKLKNEAKTEGKSVNQFVKDIIKEHLGIGVKKKYTAIHHDLDHLFGRWSEEDFQKIQEKIKRERTIDNELWT